ncbi:MAG: hypothetical protein DI538_14495 [Azospira oryzae]|nr:MAG: hypothetical protein DI538_14495 [Azospira oryzae]
MATLKKNASDTAPECGIENQGVINDRTSQPVTDLVINTIRGEITTYASAVAASSDPRIMALKKATSFPVEDIQAVLDANPNCRYLRVYNGIDSQGNYVTYLAAINEAFQSFLTEDPDNGTVITKSCCHCNPCTSDIVLN